MTHGPPFGILDRGQRDVQHQGCKPLLEAVRRIRPRIHAFGHIHECYGTAEVGETLFVNAALLGPNSSMERKPHVIRIPFPRAMR